MAVRRKVEETIRRHFNAQSFIEVRTPLLAPSPGMEVHIKTFSVSPTAHSSPIHPLSFLPTSPEFAMKKLLAGGLPLIYQICPAFRDEPPSSTHLPEFTLLEWYRSHPKNDQLLPAIQKDTEELFQSLGAAFDLSQKSLNFQNHEINFLPPWPRFKIRDLFLEFLNLDLWKGHQAMAELRELQLACKEKGESYSASDTWEDLYFRLWLNHIEPRLPKDRPVFIEDYPPEQAALARITTDRKGNSFAQRFEVYVGGLELGNAFDELTDPIEQRARFEKAMSERRSIYGDAFPSTPLDEGFLLALREGLPPSAGIAMGVDRLVMLFANEPEIQFTHWIPSSQTFE